MRKGRDLAFRRNWLQWVLDFAQIDFKSLPSSRMKILKEEVAYFCSERVFEESGEELEEGWGIFKHSLSSVGPGDYKAVTEMSNRELSKIQESALNFLKDIYEPEEPVPLPEMKSSASASQGTIKIYSYPKTDSSEDWLKINFIGLIERFKPYYPIKKCKGCGRFFLHLTEIEKIYCTSSCAARSIQRAKRERLYQDPKKHKRFLKQWSRYQKKRYEERLKAKLGPNVKVGRGKKQRQENRKGE